MLLPTLFRFPSLHFSPSSKVCQFRLWNWKGYLSKISAGKHKIIEVYAALIFCHIDFLPPEPFIWFFFQRSLLILQGAMFCEVERSYITVCEDFEKLFGH